MLASRRSFQFMMADTHVVKTEIAENILSLFDHGKFLFGDRFTVRNAGAKTGHLGFVGGGEAELGGKFADFGFGETSFFERGADLKFGSGLSAGAIVSDVAGVFAIGDYSETFGFGERGELGEKFVFAEVTAVVRIRQVTLVLEFVRFNDAHRELELFPEFEGFFEFTAGQAR